MENEKEALQEDKAVSPIGEEETKEDKGDGLSVVQSANQAAERAEKAVAELKKLKAQMDEDYSEKRLGGVTQAGTSVEVKEDTPEEYIKKVMSGEVGN